MKKLRRPFVEPLEPRIAPAVFNVINGNNSGAGSLRQAILDANADSMLDEIHFNIPFPYGVTVTTALPAVTQPTIIDGYTQPFATPGSDPNGFNATPIVTLVGTSAPAGTNGLVIQGGSSVVRGLIICGFKGNGILLDNIAANDGNRIEGNYIGLTSFLFASGNEGSGIKVLAGSNFNTIGGPDPEDGNLIGNSGGPGVELASDNNTVMGNYIGNEIAPNQGAGVAVQGFSGNIIGGLGAGQANHISFNKGPGVRIASGGGNLVSGNEIRQNVGLEIDLGGVGVTANDPTDSDTGANGLLNFPKITASYTGSAATRVSVDYVTNPSIPVRLEFYSSPTKDATGYGEGSRLLGFVNTTSDAAGVVKFTTTLDVMETAGYFISATATSANNTSEFSLAASIFSAPSFLQVAPSGKSATYRDADGDLVTVKTTKGTLTNNLFQFKPTGFTTEGAELIGLKLLDPMFAGANITITAKRAATGDGFANVGRINATNVNLGKVVVDGDLAEIDAGSGGAGVAGLVALTTHSLGLLTPAATSSINGNLGSFRVLGDVESAALSVAGKIGSVFASGSVSGASFIQATGSIGSITVLGDFIGSDTGADGFIQSGGTIGAIKVGGDLEGARIYALGDPNAPTAAKATTLKSLTVGGNVIHSKVLAGYNGTTPANARAQIGPVKVKGNWESSDLVAGAKTGGDGIFGSGDDATISANSPITSRIASIVIGAQAFGTFGGTDGHGFVAHQIAALKVGGIAFKLSKTSLDDILLGPTNDLRLHEVA